jgi:hypothetical protein
MKTGQSLKEIKTQNQQKVEGKTNGDWLYTGKRSRGVPLGGKSISAVIHKITFLLSLFTLTLL